MIFIFIGGCNSTEKREFDFIEENENKEEINIEETNLQDSIAFALCEIYGLDQGIRRNGVYSEIDKYLAAKIDSLNFMKFMAIVKKYGYPTKELLGEKNAKHDCVNAAAAVLLQNPKKIHQKIYLDILLREANKKTIPYEFVATLLDKYIWAKSGGKKVLYGSQFGMPCKNQKKETNKARKEIGLPPLADSLFINCSEK